MAAVGSGVPQGTVLGPNLFNLSNVSNLYSICLNVSKILKCKVSLYADDTKLIGCADTEENVDSTQLDLDVFTHWTDNWNLEFNAAKWKTLHLGKKNPHILYHINCSNGSYKAIFISHGE